MVATAKSSVPLTHVRMIETPPKGCQNRGRRYRHYDSRRRRSITHLNQYDPTHNSGPNREMGKLSIAFVILLIVAGPGFAERPNILWITCEDTSQTFVATATTTR
jgi:hypothetical protein